MKILFTALLALATIALSAQNIITWKGGTPGHETTWFEAKNWDKNVVPDEYSFVIIKKQNTGHYAQPVINGEVLVASIELQSNSLLIVKPSGTLIIDGTYNYSEGILFFGGKILNQGTVSLENVDQPQNKAVAQNLLGNGSVNINGILLNSQIASNH
jgi:hypothetical protein